MEILFLPFLSRASEIIGKKIHIKFDQKEILLNLNINIYSNILNQLNSISLFTQIVKTLVKRQFILLDL